MLFKYSQYLYLCLYLQVWKVLVLDSSTSESTWPQPWTAYMDYMDPDVLCPQKGR